LQQPFAPMRPAPDIEHHHPAGAEYEGRDLFGVLHAARADTLQHDYQYLLHQVRRGLLVA
jgi:hypothetical protein